jgi:hypothetical protein
MLTPALALYPLFAVALCGLLGPGRVTSQAAAAELVWALLMAQSLHPADLARALPYLRTGKARQAMRRVRRLVRGKLVRSEWLTPRLVRAAVRLAPERPARLVLDSTRLGRWELFTLGVRFGGGRVLPVAWSVLPYPWPKGAYTPTATALLERTLAAWPADCPLHLTADRGFPSLALFEALRRWSGALPLGHTIRLRAGDYVRLEGGEKVAVGALIDRLPAGEWRALRAAYVRRRQAGPMCWLVLGRAEPAYPPHQRGPADAARRERRAAERAAYLARKGQPGAVARDRAWALLTTEAGAAGAVAEYRRRFSTEGTYEDMKAWDLDTVAGREADPAHVDGLVGVAALAYFVQAAIGAAAGRAPEGAARARQGQWTTADRLSVAWRGRQVLHDRAHDWQPWLRAALADTAATLRAALPAPARAGDAHARIAPKEAA